MYNFALTSYQHSTSNLQVMMGGPTTVTTVTKTNFVLSQISDNLGIYARAPDRHLLANLMWNLKISRLSTGQPTPALDRR